MGDRNLGDSSSMKPSGLIKISPALKEQPKETLLWRAGDSTQQIRGPEGTGLRSRDRRRFLEDNRRLIQALKDSYRTE